MSERSPAAAPPEARAPSARPAALAGIAGGVVGATCCVGPAVGIATGAGAGSFLLAMSAFRPLLFGVGAVVAFAVAAFAFRRTRRSCEIPVTGVRAVRSRWIDATLLAFVATYGVGRLVLTPVIEGL